MINLNSFGNLYILLGIIFFLLVTIGFLISKLQIFIRKYEKALIDKLLAEKQAELNLQLLNEVKKRNEDFDQVKLESINYAKAAIFEVGQQLSSRLIEDHKRENEQARKNTEENLHKTTIRLHEQFQNITAILGVLNNQVQESKTTVDVVKRALLSPTGAGALAEITLENILKSSGLKEQQDYIMQYTLYNESGARQRPDAVVFLPNNNIMVIDSKASKFFLEIGQDESNDKSNYLDEKLNNSMCQHIKDLTSRDYKEAIRNQLKKVKPLYKVNYISTVMFVPSECALDKLQAVNKNFIYKAWEASIFPSGPIGLVNMLAHARFLINEHQQLNNYQNIIDEVNKLLQTVSIMYDHANKLGKTIYNSMGYYDKFAGSFNNNMLNRVRNLYKLGVISTKNFGQNLERYHIASNVKDIISDEDNLYSSTENNKIDIEQI